MLIVRIIHCISSIAFARLCNILHYLTFAVFRVKRWFFTLFVSCKFCLLSSTCSFFFSTLLECEWELLILVILLKFVICICSDTSHLLRVLICIIYYILYLVTSSSSLFSDSLARLPQVTSDLIAILMLYKCVLTNDRLVR